MTITTGVGKKFLEELPLGIHVLSEGSPSDVIKLALYGPNASLSSNNDTYTTDGEVSGGGYSAGGVTISGLTIVGRSGSARAGGLQFADPYIQPDDDATITIAGVAVRGCMLYNSSQGNRNIFVMDFGSSFTPSAGITIPWAVGDVTAFNETLIPLLGAT